MTEKTGTKKTGFRFNVWCAGEKTSFFVRDYPTRADAEQATRDFMKKLREEGKTCFCPALEGTGPGIRF